MLIRRMVDLKIGNDPNITGVRRADELTKIGEHSIIGMNVSISTNIVPVITQRRGIERQEPYGVHSEVGNVVEF